MHIHLNLSIAAQLLSSPPHSKSPVGYRVPSAGLLGFHPRHPKETGFYKRNMISFRKILAFQSNVCQANQQVCGSKMADSARPGLEALSVASSRYDGGTDPIGCKWHLWWPATFWYLAGSLASAWPRKYSSGETNPQRNNTSFWLPTWRKHTWLVNKRLFQRDPEFVPQRRPD